MKVQVDSDNFVILNPEIGGKILSLTLGGKTIISANQNDSFTSSGSYLMFPWVNRVIDNPYAKYFPNNFVDGNNLPLHGLFAASKRQVKISLPQKNKQKGLCLNLKKCKAQKEQNMFISQDKFQIQIKINKDPKDTNPFCFGYHPYLQLDENLQNLKFDTNLKKQIKLSKELLPVWPHQYTEWNGKISGEQSYDSLFIRNLDNQDNELSYVQIQSSNYRLRIQSDLKYWQIYTPKDRQRIAIQPMSFQGNLYEISKTPQFKSISLPDKAKIIITLKKKIQN